MRTNGPWKSLFLLSFLVTPPRLRDGATTAADQARPFEPGGG